MATVEKSLIEGGEPAEFSLVDMLLRQQQDLTAVERFAQLHEAAAPPLQSRYYSSLLPLAKPRPGEQYAFDVDLDACSGCKACVTACHTLNGLDENEIWREVGLLHGSSAELPIVQHVTTACHHCIEPACLKACPVNAYEKDGVTGIVRHLDDQCFGCQYCVLACPYDVPKFNKKRGIVRKCDMCSQRLAVNEAPACVQACPHQAIRITVVNRAHVVQDCETNTFLPGAPDPQHTLPTTNYRSARPLPRNTIPADYFSVRQEHSHPPLVLMLVLTQLSVGAFLVEMLLKSKTVFPGALLPGVEPIHAIVALACGLLALGASTCHLGRPQYAFRAFLGLRHSWLSREIIVFSLFAGLAMLHAGTTWLWPVSDYEDLRQAVGWSVVVSGLLGVLCSVMIYQCTRRPFWNGMNTTVKFTLTTLLLGTATALVASMLAAAWFETLTANQILAAYGRSLCQWLVVLSAAKLGFESLSFAHLLSRQNTPLRRTALLMTRELAGTTQLRFVCGIVGGMLLPGLLLAADAFSARRGFSDGFIGLAVTASFAITLVGELLERHQFFVASVAPRMPGAMTT